jgi:hypothetical protein
MGEWSVSLLRTLVSALCILAGAALIASWAVSSVIVDAVEDGTAMRGVTERALETAPVQALIAEQVADQALAALAAQGVDANGPVVRESVERAAAAAVATDAFQSALLTEVENARGEIAAQLTDSLREPAPLVLVVDVSDAVNARIDEVGAIGAEIPDVAIAPVTVQVLAEEKFETTRTTYERIEWAAQWGLWAGIALLVLGIFVSQRRRWFVAKVLFALGVICVAFGGAIALLGPDTITTFIPGGVDGPLSTLWRDVMTVETAPLVMERALWLGAAALIGAVVFVLLGAVFGGRRR